MSAKMCSQMRLLGLLVTLAKLTIAKLILPSTPPRGFNSFDIQYDRRANSSLPIWNETLFRKIAPAMASQLLPHGYDYLVIDGGWSYDTVDEFGRPTPNLAQWPSAANGAGFKPLADLTHSLGLKFGIWTLRGTSPLAVERKLSVRGASPPTTIDQIIYNQQQCAADPATVRWCNCTWDSEGVGVNASHPAAQAYYNSVLQLYEEWGVDLIKWDCMYDDGMETPSYSREEILAVKAVEAIERPMILSLSPGGGMTTNSAAWVAGMGDGHGPNSNSNSDREVRASMYRVTGDFHSRPAGWIDGLGEHAFVVGNLSSSASGSGRGLIGMNRTWPDLDILDLGTISGYFGKPAAQLHAAMWMMARSPLMFGGELPIKDNVTLNLVTNKLALDINMYSSGLTVEYEGDCRCHMSRKNGNACRLLVVD